MKKNILTTVAAAGLVITLSGGGFSLLSRQVFSKEIEKISQSETEYPDGAGVSDVLDTALMSQNGGYTLELKDDMATFENMNQAAAAAVEYLSKLGKTDLQDTYFRVKNNHYKGSNAWTVSIYDRNPEISEDAALKYYIDIDGENWTFEGIVPQGGIADRISERGEIIEGEDIQEPYKEYIQIARDFLSKLTNEAVVNETVNYVEDIGETNLISVSIFTEQGMEYTMEMTEDEKEVIELSTGSRTNGVINQKEKIDVNALPDYKKLYNYVVNGMTSTADEMVLNAENSAAAAAEYLERVLGEQSDTIHFEATYNTMNFFKNYWELDVYEKNNLDQMKYKVLIDSITGETVELIRTCYENDQELFRRPAPEEEAAALKDECAPLFEMAKNYVEKHTKQKAVSVEMVGILNVYQLSEEASKTYESIQQQIPEAYKQCENLEEMAKVGDEIREEMDAWQSQGLAGMEAMDQLVIINVEDEAGRTFQMEIYRELQEISSFLWHGIGN